MFFDKVNQRFEMGSGTRLCQGKVLSTLDHPCRSMVAKSAVFMITGHKDKRIWIYIGKCEKLWLRPFRGYIRILG